MEPPKNPPRRSDLKGYERQLPPSDLAVARGRPVDVGRAHLRRSPGTAAVAELAVVGDVILGRRRATAAELAEVIERFAGRRGVAIARRALPRIEARSGSPSESLLRLRLEDEGLPRPECNVDVFDAEGEWIACPDLLYRKAKIAIEFEGAHHLEARQFRQDVARDRLLIANGYEVLRATGRDLDPGATSLYDAIAQLLRERTAR